MEIVGMFYGPFVCFTAIWYTLGSFGIVWVCLVYFSHFWYVVKRNIWQHWRTLLQFSFVQTRQHAFSSLRDRLFQSRQQMIIRGIGGNGTKTGLSKIIHTSGSWKQDGTSWNWQGIGRKVSMTTLDVINHPRDPSLQCTSFQTSLGDISQTELDTISADLHKTV
jgi:hypothetical protein